MARLTINRGAREALSLSAVVVLLAVLFNNATIAVYSHSSGSSAADAKAKAKAKAAAHHPKSAPPPSQGSSINPKKYGAVGDGKHDDQLAINAAIAAARAAGKTVSFPAGNYLHSSVIVANGVALLGAGPGSTTLTAGDALNCAVELTGNHPSFRNFNIHGVNVAREPSSLPIDSTPQEAVIWIHAASNVIVDGNTITGAAGENGIEMFNCNTGTISNNVIANVRAVGIFMSRCNNVQVVNNSVENPKGSSVFVATDLTNVSQNITFSNNLFQGGPTGVGQGICVNSVKNFNFTNNKCTTNCLNLFIWEEDEGPAAPSSNVLVSGNTLTSGIYAGTQPPNIITGSDSNLTITNNAVGGAGIWVRQVHDVTISKNNIADTNGNGITVVDCGNVAIDSNALSNIVDTAINVYNDSIIPADTSSGSLAISNNVLSNCMTDRLPAFPIADIAVYSTMYSGPVSLVLYTSLAIVNNTLSGQANHAQEYIYCSVPSNDGVSGFTRTISGDNPGTTLLPNNIAP